MCMTPFSGPSHRSCESPQPTLQLPPAARSVGNGHPDDMGGKRADGGNGDVISTPDRESSPYPSLLQSAPAVVCADRDVRHRVIGVGVIASDPSSRPRGRKAESTTSSAVITDIADSVLVVW